MILCKGMSKAPNNSDKKPADKPSRQEKLAAALRANLQRRKAAKRQRSDAKQEKPDG